MGKSKNILKRLLDGRHDEQGRELLDPTPLFQKTDLRPPKSIEQRIKEAMRSERMLNSVRKQGLETPEEFNDFDIPDDNDEPLSQYQRMEYEEPLMLQTRKKDRSAERSEASEGQTNEKDSNSNGLSSESETKGERSDPDTGGTT